MGRSHTLLHLNLIETAIAFQRYDMGGIDNNIQYSYWPQAIEYKVAQIGALGQRIFKDLLPAKI